MFSVDVADSFYSDPHAHFCMFVEACIMDENVEFAFVNDFCINIKSILELLSFYLSSTLLGWDDEVYTQRPGT